MYVHVRRNVKVLAVLNISIKIRKHVEGNGCSDSNFKAFIGLLAKLHPEHCLLSWKRNPVQKKPKQILVSGDPRAAVFAGALLTLMIVA
jgi:hypothetical protein